MDAKFEKYGYFPLHLCAMSGCVPLFQTLMACGAWANCRDEVKATQSTCLHLAVWFSCCVVSSLHVSLCGVHDIHLFDAIVVCVYSVSVVVSKWCAI